MNKTTILPPDDPGIEIAAARLIAGGLVAFPTETVYGLGADATNDKAIARIFEVKGRPTFNPLIVHVADIAAAKDICRWTDLADKLAGRFWPGALTLVLERKERSGISQLVSAGMGSIAIRVPDQPIAQKLLSSAGIPVAAPSANPSGQVSPTTAAHVASAFAGKIDCIIDGGACRIGLESTVIDLSEGKPVLLRPGGVTVEDIEGVIGPLARPDTGGSPKSPGLLDRHYAPNAQLRLNCETASDGETLLAFGPDAPAGALNLSPTGDLVEAAANLFALIRDLDQSGIKSIAVMPIPDSGLGRAINDRLRRGANRE
ncbi:MAG: threonylcarbamoyl-AMP synthase [Rhodospirillales bacterium]|nr:threonylcarbamoyl-AMP synthase [Rhodospirillales bacterium]